MSAFEHQTREKALEAARQMKATGSIYADYPLFLVSARFATGRSFYIARSRREAQNWHDVNWDWTYEDSHTTEELR